MDESDDLGDDEHNDPVEKTFECGRMPSLAVEHRLPLFRTDAEPRVRGETPTMRQAALKSALADAEAAMRSSLREVTVADISN